MPSPNVPNGYQPRTNSASSRRADFDLQRIAARLQEAIDAGGGGGGSGTDEVWVGPSDPISTHPTIELWFDSDADPPMPDGGVPPTRKINTTAPLAGGGDLTVDRTFTIAAFTTTTSGIVPASGTTPGTFLKQDGTWGTGPVGPQGPAGATGAQGPPGTPGAAGPQGPQGDTGPQGPQGEPGVAVDQRDYRWSTSTVAADPGPGFVRTNALPGVATAIYASLYDSGGTTFLRMLQLVSGDPIDIYESGAASGGVKYTVAGTVVNNTSWVSIPVTVRSAGGMAPTNNTPVEILAPVQAPAGPQGPPGPQGPQGPTGATGAQGPQGVKGDTGATGSQGPPGTTGAQGPAGPAGADGATGAQGPQGIQGPQGPQGPVGPDEVVISATDPIATYPAAELWYQP